MARRGLYARQQTITQQPTAMARTSLVLTLSLICDLELGDGEEKCTQQEVQGRLWLSG